MEHIVERVMQNFEKEGLIRKSTLIESLTKNKIKLEGSLKTINELLKLLEESPKTKEILEALYKLELM